MGSSDVGDRLSHLRPPTTCDTAATLVAARDRTCDVVRRSALARSVSAFFGVTGMKAIFAAAAISIMVMVGALEAAKLVTTVALIPHSAAGDRGSAVHG